jgi:hypothetical protein
MFGTKGLRKRIGRAVEQTLEPGEIVESTVYLHVYGDPSLALVTGLPTNIRTWVAVLTDRRVIILKGNEVNAARSQLAAAYPIDTVTVISADPPDKPKRIELSFQGQGSARFDVPLLWRTDATMFVAGLAGS